MQNLRSASLRPSPSDVFMGICARVKDTRQTKIQLHRKAALESALRQISGKNDLQKGREVFHTSLVHDVSYTHPQLRVNGTCPQDYLDSYPDGTVKPLYQIKAGHRLVVSPEMHRSLLLIARLPFSNIDAINVAKDYANLVSNGYFHNCDSNDGMLRSLAFDIQGEREQEKSHAFAKALATNQSTDDDLSQNVTKLRKIFSKAVVAENSRLKQSFLPQSRFLLARLGVVHKELDSLESALRLEPGHGAEELRVNSNLHTAILGLATYCSRPQTEALDPKIVNFVNTYTRETERNLTRRNNSEFNKAFKASCKRIGGGNESQGLATLKDRLLDVKEFFNREHSFLPKTIILHENLESLLALVSQVSQEEEILVTDSMHRLLQDIFKTSRSSFGPDYRGRDIDLDAVFRFVDLYFDQLKPNTTLRRTIALEKALTDASDRESLARAFGDFKEAISSIANNGLSEQTTISPGFRDAINTINLELRLINNSSELSVDGDLHRALINLLNVEPPQNTAENIQGKLQLINKVVESYARHNGLEVRDAM